MMKPFLSFYIALIVVSSIMAFPVFAQINPTGSPTMKQTQRIERIRARADEELVRRMTALNKLMERINVMQKISMGDKTMLIGEIQEQIAALTALQEKIKIDNDLASLQAYAKSITSSHLIFALVIPKGHLLAAADRLTLVSDTMTTFIAKLQTRIDELQSSGVDVLSWRSMLADANLKVADAKVQAQAAIAKISVLVLDEGDQDMFKANKEAMFKANKEALMSARSYIKIGTQDLHAARKDTHIIVQEIKKFNVSGGAEFSLLPSSSPVVE